MNNRLSRLMIPVGENGTDKQDALPPRSRQSAPFLRGPVPMPWLAKAMALPGKALHVGVVLWHKEGFNTGGGGEPIVLSLAGMGKKYGINRTTAGRALKALREAGLVEVFEAKNGQAVRVRIVRTTNRPR